MSGLRCTHPFQNVNRPQHVGRRILKGVFDGTAIPDTGGQVTYPILPCNSSVDRFAVQDISVKEANVQAFQVAPVPCPQTVQDRYNVPTNKQLLDHMRADETCTTGDEYTHLPFNSRCLP